MVLLSAGLQAPERRTTELPAIYRGSAAAVAALNAGSARPLGLASADFNEDGFPDLAAGDFNADDHFDLVVAARDSDLMFFFPGDGKGGFGEAVSTTRRSELNYTY